jgi:hypothetical protein
MPLPAIHFSIGPIDSRCLENSCNTLPRSSLHILRLQLSLELNWRQISKGRVQAFLVVDLFQELGDRGAGLDQITILVAQDLFVLQRFHERLAGRVIPRTATAAHADVDSVRLQHVGVIVACILTAATRCGEPARTINPSRSLTSLARLQPEPLVGQ